VPLIRQLTYFILFVHESTVRIDFELNYPVLSTFLPFSLNNKIISSRVQYSIVQYSAVQCSTVQCSTVQCSTVHYSAVQYSTV
jgi:hypothetical protein